MDKNSTIGLVLIFAIVLGYTYWKQPSEEERARMIAVQDSISQVQQAEASRIEEEAAAAVAVAEEPDTDTLVLDTTAIAVQDSLRKVEKASRFGLFAGSAEGVDKEVLLSNGLVELKLTSKGAAPKTINLPLYRQYAEDGKGDEVQLFDPDSNDFHYQFNADGHFVRTDELYFNLLSSSDSAAVFRADAGNGRYMEVYYELHSGSYLVDHGIRFVGLGDKVNPSALSLNWNTTGYKNEKSVSYERQSCSVFYKYKDEDRDYLSEGTADEEKLDGRAEWIAFKQKFFTLAMVKKDGFFRQRQ